MNTRPLIQIKDVKKHYFVGNKLENKYLKAVDGVTLDIPYGQTLGLVGESGCGKSTLGRVILRLQEKTEGQIVFDGTDLYSLSPKELTHFRNRMQIIFQDPYACLNPRLRIQNIIAEPLKFHERLSKKEREERVKQVMSDVGLTEDIASRFPHELSGGQQQRVGIARALILRPQFIVCDEPVSALDVSVQAQILNLLDELKREYGLTYLFISHNLAVVHHICDRIAVMYLGRIVEIADKEELFENPVHPYTKALISAVLPLDEQNTNRIILKGDLPDPVNPPKGCTFKTRCSLRSAECDEHQKMKEIRPGHWVRCCKCALNIEV